MSNAASAHCAICGALAPKVRSAATLAAVGWRIDSSEDEHGQPRFRWLCAQCFQKRTGVAPLRRPEG